LEEEKKKTTSSPLSVEEKEREERRKERRKRNKEKYLDELIGSENFYVRFLDIVINTFLVPLRTMAYNKKITITGEQIQSMFCNIEQIKRIHELMHDELRKNRQVLGQVFLKYSVFLNLYSVYLKNYDNCVEIVNKQKDNKVFQNFLADKRADKKTGGLNLMSFLIMPIQRIPRYYYLLKELQASTELNDPEFKILGLCVDKMFPMSCLINEQRPRIENMAKILNVQNRITGKFPSLLTPNRTFMREGEFQKLSRKRFVVFLFSDLLLWTNYKFQFRGMIGNYCLHLSAFSNEQKRFGFQVTSLSPPLLSSTKKTSKQGIDLICICLKVREQKEWMKKMNEVISTATEEVKARKERAYSVKNDVHRIISSSLIHLHQDMKAKKEKEKAEKKDKVPDKIEEGADSV